MSGFESPIFPFTRREFIKTIAGAGIALAGGVSISAAANPTGKKLHGLSSFGDLKYDADYTVFDYASPDAPKGGVFSFSPSNWGMNQNTQTFNTLNTFVLKGAAPPRMELCFDTLMISAIDEPDAIYCSTAKTVEISEDRNSYIFELREEARFHDGSVLSAEDVVFSCNIIKEKGHPQLAQNMRDLVEIRALSDNRVELRFNGKQSDRAILAVAASVPIFSRRYYETREFDSSSLEAPLSSGQWKVGNFSAGQFIEYLRVEDYWAKDMPFARGLGHFAKLRIEFYAERTAGFEAFKKGDILWRQEFTSKVWATEYGFPAVKQGKVVQKLFPGELRPSMQGWALNTRRDKFKDVRVRRAIGLCFDFEWTNKNLFYNAYARSQSLFEKSPFKAEGIATGEELTLLKSLGDDLPQSVFGEAIMQPVSDGTGNDRANLRKAFGLFQEAGWNSKGGKLLNAQGEQFKIEFLIRSKTFEKVLGGMVANLRQLGVDVSIRLVDPSQYQARTDKFDFDIVGMALSFTASPTQNSLKQIFHSDSADLSGSRNYPGVRVKAVDQLIEKLGKVKSRDELTIIMRVMDRVLRTHQYWIPNWYSANHRVAMWDVFGWKEPKPDYAFPVEQLWWYEETKAKKIGL
ncbi:MAG: extracellular solute-binding protein [Rhizobiaceae bacterium]|nr:extracellular solute-binding protein [Rhizobiaceae bacterium]